MDVVRTCIGCRARASTTTLQRFVAASGCLLADANGSLPGRGAWVHPAVRCVDVAVTRRAFARALRCRIDDTQAAFDAVRTHPPTETEEVERTMDQS